ncbi:hypothetical protein C1646_769580 [Rhizophagus diaphanus]|nr:hypothetical protein C1646_769580 [Rhizophagus diaphanus] [Rhizophagus sp. MUCL 43196]
MFEQLNVLESVHIIFCCSLNTTSLIQQILNLSKPFKLRPLFLNGTSGINESSSLLLLQKSGCYLKNFSSEIFRFRGSSIILQNLGQIFSSKLEYLDLTLCIEVSDFEVFLKNSRYFIKKFLIKDLKRNNYNNILPYTKKYIMMEKRFGYLNFRNHNKELFDFTEIEANIKKKSQEYVYNKVGFEKANYSKSENSLFFRTRKCSKNVFIMLVVYKLIDDDEI